MTHLNAYQSQQSLWVTYAAAHKPSKAQLSKSSPKTKNLSPSAPLPDTEKTVKAAGTRPVVAAAETKKTNPLSLQPTSTPLPYTIQVSAFRDAQTSNQVAAKLRTGGDRAFTCPVEIPDKGKWNRVYIGHYKTYKEAKAAAAGLKKRNFRYVHVTKTPYAVEVGLVGSQQAAQNLKSRLREKGYLGYTLAASSGQNQIRILVGAYESKKAAESCALLLFYCL